MGIPLRKIHYNGEKTEKALHEYMIRLTVNCYGVYYSTLGEITILLRDRAFNSVYAPGDYPAGYWYKGEHKKWSINRIIRNQNTGIIDN